MHPGFNKYKTPLFILAFFAVLYSSISLVNHYLFRTYALDLGAYTHALYDYAHFQWNDSRAFKPIAENLLADHFDLYLMIFSPLVWIFKSYTLLIVQILFILVGGWGVYSYFCIEKATQKMAKWAMLWYLSFFGIFSALAFDYHSNVVAASLVPWLFYFFKREQLKAAIFIFLSILIAKENMSLWMVFISIGLAWNYRKFNKTRNILLLLAIFSALYFIAVTNWIMPAFSNKGSYPHFHYSVLGNNSKEALLFLLSHPFESLKILFTNHISLSAADGIKTEFYIYLLISGFFILLRKPIYIFMLIPVFFQKMFHDNYIFWSTSSQYSIEYAAVMAIGIFEVLNTVASYRWKHMLLVLVLIGNLGITVRIMDAPIVSNDRTRIRFYKKSHYHRDFNTKTWHHLLRSIPKEAIVSAQSPILPHLSLRDFVYQFPNIDNAAYIVLSKELEPYPLTDEDFLSRLNQLRNSSEWEIWFEEEGLYIFRKT
jgi:uncharacterized membrane protein